MSTTKTYGDVDSCSVLPSPAQPSHGLSKLVSSCHGPGGSPRYKASCPLPIALTSYSACSTFVQLPPSNEMTQCSTPPLEQHQR